MSNDLILMQREGACLTVLINRRDKANSLTPDMLVQLREAFEDAKGDESLRAVIITGAGGRVFCAGADLDTLYDESNGEDLWAEMSEALCSIPILTIAAINGPCMGGGLTLALGCDIRVGVPEARFSYPVLKNNVLPGQYDVNRLRDLIGPGRSAVILLGGSAVSSEDALAWGLVDRLTTRDALEETCRDFCAIAAQSNASHLKTLKSMLKGRSS
ncbi:enoyl-CoA hydratase/isomerase family protein [Alphaproteobacteria bacterium]|nr:enoyl-CoA hydratase/isomerase family protein [Alphaproteobacteria bacterium]